MTRKVKDNNNLVQLNENNYNNFDYVPSSYKDEVKILNEEESITNNYMEVLDETNLNAGPMDAEEARRINSLMYPDGIPPSRTLYIDRSAQRRHTYCKFCSLLCFLFTFE